MESSLKPLIQFLASPIMEHLGKVLEERIEAFHLGMDLANLPKRRLFFFGEVQTRTKHQSYGASWLQFDGCCRLAHFHPLLLHTAEPQEKPFNRHARAGISTIRQFAEETDGIALPFNPTCAQIGFIGSQNAWTNWAFCAFGKRLRASSLIADPAGITRVDLSSYAERLFVLAGHFADKFASTLNTLY